MSKGSFTSRFMLFAFCFVMLIGLACNNLYCQAKNDAEAKDANATAKPKDTKATASSKDAKAPDQSTVLARIGEKVITEGDLKSELDQIPVYARKRFLTKEGKKDILDKMIKDELLYLAAVEKKLDQDAEIKKNLESMRKRILSNAYFTKYIRDSVKIEDKKIEEYYNKNKTEYRVAPKVKIRDILVPTKEKADQVIARLKKGEDFKEVAKTESTHEPTKTNGGYIGWVNQDGNVPYLGDVPEIMGILFKLKKDQLSDPIKTDKGFHIIKVEDVKPEEFRKFDEVKNQIVDKLSVSDQDVEKYYNEHPEKYKEEAKLKISQIQFDTKEEADKVLKELKGKASFSEMAKQYSKDKSSAASGGSIGYLKRNGYIRGVGKEQEITDTLFKLPEGSLSDVLKSTKGYHIFKIDKIEPDMQKPLNDVKTLVRNQLLREQKEAGLESAFDNLKKKYKCTVNYDSLTDSPESELETGEDQGIQNMFMGQGQ